MIYGSIEDAVLAHWLAIQASELDRKLDARSYVRQRVQPLLSISWDDRAERCLVHCMLNYSRTLGITFMQYFARHIGALYGLSYEQERKLQQDETKDNYNFKH